MQLLLLLPLLRVRQALCCRHCGFKLTCGIKTAVLAPARTSRAAHLKLRKPRSQVEMISGASTRGLHRYNQQSGVSAVVAADQAAGDHDSTQGLTGLQATAARLAHFLFAAITPTRSCHDCLCMLMLLFHCSCDIYAGPAQICSHLAARAQAAIECQRSQPVILQLILDVGARLLKGKAHEWNHDRNDSDETPVQLIRVFTTPGQHQPAHRGMVHRLGSHTKNPLTQNLDTKKESSEHANAQHSQGRTPPRCTHQVAQPNTQ